ncbi:phage regulatory CII family protein [Azospirillum picis]|uniref:Metal-dependent phosphoesterase TrpH n=1 Tax=Azospirillum picis TaxID=488438 RepID=A0ABU0MNQ5_9PROT|nr:phage regulatory CII family protein [Azospirillum picis]MBP2301272.1 putative metal-dependent phosphoesterase TrpH [Azospirillum picis]MDQ0535103.1 putative metal-dependent phosphoesterase TrpH [Azospirillum picis]
MPKSPYMQRRPGTLKAAVADLIERCGGFARSAELARVSRSQLFRYSNDSEDDASTHMPADIVAALERYCSTPVVTEWLAAEATCTLLRVEIDASEETIPQNVAEIAQHASKLFAEFAAAFTDGLIDGPEAARMLAAGDAMIREYMHLRPALTGRTRA